MDQLLDFAVAPDPDCLLAQLGDLQVPLPDFLQVCIVLAGTDQKRGSSHPTGCRRKEHAKGKRVQHPIPIRHQGELFDSRRQFSAAKAPMRQHRGKVQPLDSENQQGDDQQPSNPAFELARGYLHDHDGDNAKNRGRAKMQREAALNLGEQHVAARYAQQWYQPGKAPPSVRQLTQAFAQVEPADIQKDCAQGI